MTTEQVREFPVEKLAEQFAGLLAKGGNLGMVFDYDEKDYDVLYALGHSMYTQGSYKDAVVVFGYLNALNPLERRFANSYASSLQMTGQFEEAMKFFGMVSAMDMRDPVPTFHICECMIALGRLEESRSGLSIVISQCKKPEQKALAVRAQALLDLLSQKPPAA